MFAQHQHFTSIKWDQNEGFAWKLTISIISNFQIIKIIICDMTQENLYPFAREVFTSNVYLFRTGPVLYQMYVVEPSRRVDPRTNLFIVLLLDD